MTRVLVTVLAAAIAAAACQHGGETAGKGGSGDAAHGQQIFVATCATCHGADGKGVKGLGKSLSPSEFVRKSSDTDLVLMIARGREPGDPQNTTGIAMPPNGGNAALTEKDLRDVVAYLRTLG